MKILVTGCAGFIGFHLYKRLLELGNEIIGYDNINDYYDTELKYGRLNELGFNKSDIVKGNLVVSKLSPVCKFVLEDLENKSFLNSLFESEKFDIVINLAAQAGVRYSLTNPDVYMKSNIVGFLNLLEACRHNPVKHLVYASSSSVYGANTKMPYSESDTVDHPISLYAASKKANELMAHTYSHLFNIPTTGLRFFTVYGPWGRPDMALALFTKSILQDEPINIFNNGDMLRDFTYVDDIVEGIIRISNKAPGSNVNSTDNSTGNSNSTVPYKIYNIGNSSPVRLMEYVEAIETSLNKIAKKNFLPMQLGDVPNTYADSSNLQRDIDYKPATKVPDGVDKYIKWYKEYYKL
ncbi:MAG: NAD-dependent epimerase [Bacteroidota bacterium]